MIFCRQSIYNDWSDRDLVAAVTTIPHNEEAGLYLMCVRYSPMLKTVYRDFHFDLCLYDDCVSELYLYMRGKDGNWHYLAGFEWRSSFGTWFRYVAYTQFPKIYFKLIEKGAEIVSLDEESDDSISIIEMIPSEDDIESEQNMQRVIMMEAIMQIENEDDKFIILKYLKGYSGKETALMLEARWKRFGTAPKDKYGNKIKPTEQYINVHVQRTKKELRVVVQEMLKCNC